MIVEKLISILPSDIDKGMSIDSFEIFHDSKGSVMCAIVCHEMLKIIDLSRNGELIENLDISEMLSRDDGWESYSFRDCKSMNYLLSLVDGKLFAICYSEGFKVRENMCEKDIFQDKNGFCVYGETNIALAHNDSETVFFFDLLENKMIGGIEMDERVVIGVLCDDKVIPGKAIVETVNVSRPELVVVDISNFQKLAYIEFSQTIFFDYSKEFSFCHYLEKNIVDVFDSKFQQKSVVLNDIPDKIYYSFGGNIFLCTLQNEEKVVVLDIENKKKRLIAKCRDVNIITKNEGKDIYLLYFNKESNKYEICFMVNSMLGMNLENDEFENERLEYMMSLEFDQKGVEIIRILVSGSSSFEIFKFFCNI